MVTGHVGREQRGWKVNSCLLLSWIFPILISAMFAGEYCSYCCVGLEWCFFGGRRKRVCCSKKSEIPPEFIGPRKAEVLALVPHTFNGRPGLSLVQHLASLTRLHVSIPSCCLDGLSLPSSTVHTVTLNTVKMAALDWET